MDDLVVSKNARAEQSSLNTEWERKTFDLSNLAASDALGLYLKEATLVPLLSREQEIDLAKAVCRGEKAQRRLQDANLSVDECAVAQSEIKNADLAREHLILANTRLVISVAKKYRDCGVPFVDLIQEGNMGLMKAMTKYDHTLGYRFATYATWWIRQCITRAISDQGRTIRIPVHMHGRIQQMYRVAYQLEQESGCRPTAEDIAQRMELALHEIRWMLKVSSHPLSLERPVGDDDDGEEMGQFVQDNSVPAPDDTVFLSLLREQLERVLETLTPREVRILRLRFGLEDGFTYTLEQVGNKFGLTRERIRQIEHKALRRLRHPRRSRALRDYLP